MSKKAAIILAVAALLVGVIAGGWSVAALYGRITSRVVIGSLTSDASMAVVQLKHLRAGDTTNVIELMEIKLDGDLIGLTPFIDDPRELKSDPVYFDTLRHVRDYRTQFPHKSDLPETDKIFTLLDEKPVH